jgi:hypothetical protein
MASVKWSSSTRLTFFFFPGSIAKGLSRTEWASQTIHSSAPMARISFTRINPSSPLPCRFQGHQSWYPPPFIVNYESSHDYHSMNKVSLPTIGIYGMWRMSWALCLAFRWHSGLGQDSQPPVCHIFHDSCPAVPRQIVIFYPLPLLLCRVWTWYRRHRSRRFPLHSRSQSIYLGIVLQKTLWEEPASLSLYSLERRWSSAPGKKSSCSSMRHDDNM